MKINKIQTLNDQKICVNFDLQRLEQPTQRLMISRLIGIKAKNAHKPGVRSPCYAVYRP